MNLMTEKTQKYLKIAFCTFMTLCLFTIIFGILIFSNPFFMNLFSSSLIKSSGVDPNTIDFHAYSKEEFATEFFNISLTPKDDFINLFESHYGTENKKEGLLFVTYDIRDPNNTSIYTLYGINKHMDLIYKNTRILDFSDPRHRRIILHRSENNGTRIRRNQLQNLLMKVKLKITRFLNWLNI
jgi:hypothetical protein